MSKLHMYSKGTKDADGDGTLNSTQEFTVTISWGTVTKANAYEIKQGQDPSGDTYNCLAGASKNGVARFKKA